MTSTNDLYIEIPDSQQEDEDDLSSDVSFKDAIVMNTDWTIDTLNNQIVKKNIDLEPGFQRRSAWDETRKSKLIESMIVGIPVPSIVLAENKEKKGRFIVIDGKQRLLSINDFFSNKFPLRKLEMRNDLNGLTYSNLPEQDREYLDNNTFRSTLIRNWRDEDFLYAIFYRLNSGSLPLSPQELRKSLIGSKLLNRIESYLIESKEFKALFGDKLDKRMRDSELILRYLSYDISLDKYAGSLKGFLDNVVLTFENNWEDMKEIADISLQRLNIAFSTAEKIFGKDSFKKWTEEGKYERTINRAIFDSIIRFFSQEELHEKYIDNSKAIIESFKAVCLDSKFKEAVEKTTKTKIAVDNRLDIWGEELAKTISAHYDKNSRRIL
ncbi:DUF262 domain-containing protein [Dickeya chrysanthemi]|uniref:DUF262 domain-containing protein n=1 Tax=Dickeya chrysanthemi TaxID=556 RepID=UPI00301B17EE